ncbi:MAG: hypothetical protein K1X88_35935 [Nannocystaceae bacterium]|nr:hypothetical protein [Nannocystaceae bacterium]
MTTPPPVERTSAHRVRQSTLAVAWALAACKGDGDGKAAPRVEAVHTAPGTAAGADTKAADATAKPAAPLVQAQAAAPGKAKAAQHLGFDLALDSTLWSLQGTVATAPWGSSGEGDLAAVRDDDLGTAWRCQHGGATPCVLGLSFEQPVSLRAVRLWAAAGPKWHTYRAHPRPKTVRVHTDAGAYEVRFDDGAAHRYVILPASVKTQTVAVEIVDVFAGSKGKSGSKDASTLWISELEAFGDDGPMRPPLQLDPARTVVSFETEAWKTEGTHHTIRLAFLEQVGDGGALRRLMRATAMHGEADDRFWVVERRFGDDCTAHQGGYFMLDRQTRVMFPLGDKADVPATVTLREDGLGAMFVREQAPEHTVALVYENDALVRHSPRTKKGESVEQFAARLGFTGAPVRRGGWRPGEAAGSCSTGVSQEALVQQVATALDLSGLRAADASVCTIDEGHRAVIGTDGAACGARWYAAVVGPGNEIVAQTLAAEGDSDGAAFLVVPGAGVIVEGTRGGGATSDLWRLDATGITMLVKGGALAVREPKACRPCQPATPVAVDTDGATSEDGGDAGKADAGNADGGKTDGGSAADPPADPGADAGADDPLKALPSVDDEPG